MVEKNLKKKLKFRLVEESRFYDETSHNKEADRRSTHNVTLRRVRVTTVAVKTHKLLDNLCVCE